jgi:hypothetical protein
MSHNRSSRPLKSTLHHNSPTTHKQNPMKSNTQIEIVKSTTPGWLRTLCGLAAGIALLSLGTSAATAASILDSAEALYKLDYANSGSVATAGNFTDSSGNGHNATNIYGGTNFAWTSVPSTGPTGGPAIDSPADSGLSFTQADDTGTAKAGFAVASGLSLSGSQAIMSRIKWGGYLTGQNQAWIFNAALASEGTGFLFGIKPNGTDNVLTINTSKIGGGADQNILATSLKLTLDTWYDIGVSWDSTNSSLTFFLGSAADGVQSQTFTDIVMPLDSTGFFRVGAQSPQTPSNLKAFNGSMDYAAVFDQAITEAEFTTATIPEPSSFALLGIAGLLAVAARRRLH